MAVPMELSVGGHLWQPEVGWWVANSLRLILARSYERSVMGQGHAVAPVIDNLYVVLCMIYRFLCITLYRGYKIIDVQWLSSLMSIDVMYLVCITYV